MPRYFFNLVEHETILDPEGSELPDLEAARQVARESARDIVCGEIKAGRLNLEPFIEVVDEQGALLFSLQFRDAFDVKRDSDI